MSAVTLFPFPYHPQRYVVWILKTGMQIANEPFWHFWGEFIHWLNTRENKWPIVVTLQTCVHNLPFSSFIDFFFLFSIPFFLIFFLFVHLSLSLSFLFASLHLFFWKLSQRLSLQKTYLILHRKIISRRINIFVIQTKWWDMTTRRFAITCKQ